MIPMRVVRAVLLILLLPLALTAQGGGDVVARARLLVNNGDAKAARALIDSALAAAPAGSAAYADALYWRGVLAEEGDAARTDLLRVAIEFPLSSRASDALLRLAQLEFARGDRVNGRRYLDQLMREHPDAPVRAAARFWMARLLLEDSKPGDACEALRDARRLAAAGDIELINQIDFYARPCDAIALDAKGRADSLAADRTRKTADAATATASTGKWSVQVAAYGDRRAAVALVKKLKGRGADARVTPEKPWRVRIGHYATRVDAAAAAKKYSSAKAKAFVVEAEGR